MRKQRTIMGMPVTIDIADKRAREEDINEVFSYFHHIDDKFSPYKESSEVSQINRGEVKHKSGEMEEIFMLSEQTKNETMGYFDIYFSGKLDPSGIVKGYAISNGAKILKKKGLKNFYVEIAGDIQVEGFNHEGKKWSVGIQNPFNLKEVIKILYLTNMGIATSGNYRRGQHILDPKLKKGADDIASISVVAKDVFDADRFATAAFAMGEAGINFLEKQKGLEGYLVTKTKRAILTSGFEKLTAN